LTWLFITTTLYRTPTAAKKTGARDIVQWECTHELLAKNE